MKEAYQRIKNISDTAREETIRDHIIAYLTNRDNPPKARELMNQLSIPENADFVNS